MRTRLKILGGLVCVIGLLAFISSDMGRSTVGWCKNTWGLVGEKAQLKVRQIHVPKLLQYTTKADIQGALQIAEGEPILQIDLDAARQRLEQLPWVRSCTVQRYLPNDLYIFITEKEPIAIWQNNKKYQPLDEFAEPIGTSKKMPSDLLLVVGENAPESLLVLLKNLEQVPELNQYVRAAVRIGNRRWNLRLFDVERGVEVMLPEDEVMLPALQRLLKSDKKEKLLKRKVRTIDMRQKDKIILKTLDEGQNKTKGKKK